MDKRVFGSKNPPRVEEYHFSSTMSATIPSPAIVLAVSTTDRDGPYMAEKLHPEGSIVLENPISKTCVFETETGDVLRGNVINMTEREDQVVRALGTEFRFGDHSIDSDNRKNWIWHWLGLEKNALDSAVVNDRAAMFKYFMDQPWFHMCISAEDANDKVVEDPSTFIVRLSRTDPGAISVTANFHGDRVPKHVRAHHYEGETMCVTFNKIQHCLIWTNLVPLVKSWIEGASMDDYLPPLETAEPAKYIPVGRPAIE